MQTIYKYRLGIAPERQAVDMPTGAQILTAQIQADVLFVWAFVDTDKPITRRVFQVVATGQQMSVPSGILGDELSYLNSVQDGPYVWHVFEVLHV